ncbi:DNA-3-methyladenine glycosylase I [Vagococcus elongatus]|uniref:DNA-3-methyladenine glycosylase n=1 Tax=Vagococcus elongatus TaxID=180344 RepID=A0A430B1W8_9ENTE|nr:DNA-3-methyladenine glycosylase I [Vagococcus elongatus]RSU14289.1 DNA-3-methyladenine glycosylase [Vagococcus elongatus]
MEKVRCDWANQSEIERIYHDTQWGRPAHEDGYLFEMLVLESMQAGLSWKTILDKREAFREAFDQFDIEKVSRYDEKKIAELLSNPKIIRNKLKIQAAVNNAEMFLKIQKDHGSFDQFIWSYVNHQPVVNNFYSLSEVPSTTELAERITKDLKKAGFKFIGPTIIYAYMQSIGMVNDHLLTCEFRHC